MSKRWQIDVRPDPSPLVLGGRGGFVGGSCETRVSLENSDQDLRLTEPTELRQKTQTTYFTGLPTRNVQLRRSTVNGEVVL